jgi:hypothetical protein
VRALVRGSCVSAAVLRGGRLRILAAHKGEEAHEHGTVLIAGLKFSRSANKRTAPSTGFQVLAYRTCLGPVWACSAGSRVPGLRLTKAPSSWPATCVD